MRSLLARITGIPPVRVKIRPECDYVFLRGHGEEAVGQYLRGKVTLSVREGESVKGVQLRLSRQISLWDHKTGSGDETRVESSVVHEWDSFLVKGHPSEVSRSGRVYEWPFEVFIQGHQEESFRGCARCSNTYRLDVFTIHKDSSQTLQDFIPIRIIRLPSLSAYELMDPVTEQGKLLGKIEHSVSLGHKAIALGGLIPIHAELAQIDDGVQATKAKFCLYEHHKTLNDGVASYEGRRLVEEWALDLSHKDEQVQTWEQCLRLPKVVRKCSPDLDLCGVAISHTLHFAVTLKEGDTEAEYETSLPITLFVSPELPINGWGAFVQEDHQTNKGALESLSEGIQAPPRYCKVDEGERQYEIIVDAPPAYSRL
ncbi:Arrestin-C domain-containing protein [Fusarium sp. LHS14.1]|nr:Arrestin-C domain-containing protein [Fusarium sp. LHS14.1]